MVRILFTTSNTAANPTISIDSSEAKAIRPISSSSGMANKIAAGEVIDLVYDGSNFVMTKGNAATTSFYGITKLSSATNSTAEDVAATPKAVKDAADAKVDKAGDTMTGNFYVAKAGNALVQAGNSNTGVKLNLDTGSSANHGIYSYGYYDGSSFHSAAGWMIYRDSSGNVIVNGKAENVTGIVAVANGGTGATTAAAANANLHNYNLLEGVQLSYNTDLNTIVTPNIYRTTSDSNTASLVNKPPVTQPFQLAVMYIHGDYAVMQHVNEWLTGNEWRRFGYISGGSWTWLAWQKISAAVISGSLGTSNISTSSGTILNGSTVTYSYDNNFISINYYIRLQDTTGRPTVTVTGLPNMGSGFVRPGAPTLVRIGTDTRASDSTFATASGTAMTINMYNFIGPVPAGTGYMAYSGSFVVPTAP